MIRKEGSADRPTNQFKRVGTSSLSTSYCGEFDVASLPFRLDK